MHADKNRIYKLKSSYLLKTIKKESQSRDPLTDGRMTRDRVKHKQKLRKLAARAQLTSLLLRDVRLTCVICLSIRCVALALMNEENASQVNVERFLNVR